jgi:hypothetical protein
MEHAQPSEHCHGERNKKSGRAPPFFQAIAVAMVFVYLSVVHLGLRYIFTHHAVVFVLEEEDRRIWDFVLVSVEGAVVVWNLRVIARLDVIGSPPSLLCRYANEKSFTEEWSRPPGTQAFCVQRSW